MLFQIPWLRNDNRFKLHWLNRRRQDRNLFLLERRPHILSSGADTVIDFCMLRAVWRQSRSISANRRIWEAALTLLLSF